MRAKTRSNRLTNSIVDLTEANLNEVELRNVDLSGANLCGVDLTGAVLKSAKLAGAQFDERTILPNSNYWIPGDTLSRFGIETKS